MSFDFGGFGAGGGDPRLDLAREALAARDFERAIHIAGDVLAENPMDAQARAITDTAQEKIEAQPFVMQFVRKAEESLSSGNAALARTQLEKARSLDEDHPEVVALDEAIRSREAQPASFSFEAPAAPTPSFVVDPGPASAPSGRGAAQASDFGFKFEQAEPAQPDFAAFSFDAPVAEPEPVSPPAPSGFSFGEASVPAAQPAAPATEFSFDTPVSEPAPAATSAFSFGDTSGPREFDFSNVSDASPEDQRKIQQYLEEGDRAFEVAEYQRAIDLWSRIFLIDVTNEAASDRIERAKVKRREIDQQVESMLGGAVHAFDRKDFGTARTQFEQVLRLDPTNTTAHDYLSRIPQGADTISAPATKSAPPPPPSKVELDLLEDEPTGSGFEAPLLPPDPDDMDGVYQEPQAQSSKKASPAKAAPAKKKKSPLPLIAAAVGLLVLLAGGWFAWSKFGGAADVDPALTQAIFTRATNLAQAGRYDDAIAALQEVKPDDPQRDRALSMIADLQTKRTKAAQTIDGKPASAFYADNIEVAIKAFESHDYITAKSAFEQAMRAKALPPELKQQYTAAAQQVAKLEGAKALFAERKYQEAIANLESLIAQDPENKNVQRLLIDAHFNVGATALREERIPDAIKEFDQVLAMDPTDELAKRSKELALRYEDQQKDLLYKTYVKYVPLRQAS